MFNVTTIVYLKQAWLICKNKCAPHTIYHIRTNKMIGDEKNSYVTSLSPLEDLLVAQKYMITNF
jgi:hypothetical protein